jgi:alkanesulfonate monooxygenase SsuD/methylene tetrahydromethanopterin reductase-like flavin-dependent oxidoreductase (luciferase family)
MNKNFLKIWFMSHYIYPETIEIAKTVEEAGYDYMLIPYKSGQPDPLVKTIIMLQNTKKLNFLIAMSGYAVSEPFLMMYFETIKELFPDRKVLINIVDGGPFEDLSKYYVDRENVKSINRNFVKSLKSQSDIKFVFSGSSDDVVQNVKDFGEFQLIPIYDFEPGKYDRVMIPRLIICARETDQEAADFASKTFDRMIANEEFSPIVVERLRKTSIIGSYENVVKQMRNLLDNGADGFLVSDIPFEWDIHNAHKVMDMINES